jgi:hypothetical protein
MLQHRHGHHEGPLAGDFALAALTLAHAFADNPTAQLPVDTTPTILASVIVTPKVTGKFHVTCTCNVTNPTEATIGLAIGVGNSPAPIVDYLQGGPITVQPQNRINNAITVEYGSGPLAGVTFPVGVPVQIDFIGVATDPGLIIAFLKDAQITVEELPN